LVTMESRRMGFIRSWTGAFELKRMPWTLLGAAVVMSLIGVLFITSAHSAALAGRQLTFLIAAVIGFFVVAFMDYHHLASLSPALYAAGCVALAMLPLFGVLVNNARRWYDLGPVRMQPSEPMKYVTVIALATYFSCTARRERLRDLIIPLLLVAPPILLIVSQPDLGSAMILPPLFLGMAFLSGVPIRNIALVIGIGAALAVVMWFTPGALHQYQKDRLLSFVDPESRPELSASYNARQATLAVTAGGPMGQGWGQGRMNLLRRVPERHTDFIFPVIAEEWGFFRCTCVILLYVMMFALMARIAIGTEDMFGRMLVGGVLIVFAFQSFLHIAISLRLAPITGLTLPLISYGGSSLVSTFAGLGLVASVATHGSRPFPELSDSR
jgi:rod shape determining protein RodA